MIFDIASVCFFKLGVNGHLQVIVADFEERQSREAGVLSLPGYSSISPKARLGAARRSYSYLLPAGLFIFLF